MSRNGIIVNVDHCIGCMACVVACKEENKVAPDIQWNQIRRVENEKAGVIGYYRVACMHCEDAACLKACPVKAIGQGPGGEVLVDAAKCIGCKLCLAACPYGVPKFNDSGRTSYWDGTPPLREAPKAQHQQRPAGRAERCTLCVHRTSAGLEPKCVSVCPTKTLVFVDYERPSEETKALLAKARPMTESAGARPRVRYVSSHFDFTQHKLKA